MRRILMVVMASAVIASACESSGSRLPGGEAEVESREVTFTSGGDLLTGTLMLPAGGEGLPGVVVLAGSDRSARGELRMRMGREFALRGIAALVYDSPGTGGSEGNAMVQTRDQRAAEALEAAEWLGTVKEVDAGSVGVFGGSEGGDIALLAGMREPCPAFVVPASASVGGSIFEVMRHRAESAGARLGLGAGEILKAVTFKELMYVFMSGADIVEWPLIEARVSAWGDDTWKEFAAIARGRIDEAEGGAEDGQGREAAFETLKEVLARFGGESWFAATDAAGTLQRMTVMDARTFFLLLGSNRFSSDWDRTVCPAEVAGICCPLFALWGEYDSFLPPRISASRLRSYLGGSGRSGDRIEVLAGGSHYLTTGGPSAPFVDGAFDSIASWIKGVTSP